MHHLRCGKIMKALLKDVFKAIEPPSLLMTGLSVYVEGQRILADTAALNGCGFTD
jgi:hypothetical protein